MPQPTDQKPPEKKFDDHSVIVPPHRLKSVVQHTREPGTVAMDVVARAEAALAEIRGEFSHWMAEECARLEAARTVVREKGLSKESTEQLFHPAHDIKGSAETLGFPLAARIANSLCRLLLHTPDKSRIPMPLIEHHVAAIRATVRENIGDMNNRSGIEVAEKLAIMAEQFLAGELKDSYAEIAGDVAPGIMRVANKPLAS
ncbi:MAG: Hpt domain-containing protein [Xanthobacteraceae bacterium]|nr:Hpt domain-containing protein [Xanthobacteraceae bacterium]QYK43947.1 MAG: Hpt domain-containing protein [Xanthobacteraceae bacterium]